jgi:HEAT repeat protein
MNWGSFRIVSNWNSFVKLPFALFFALFFAQSLISALGAQDSPKDRIKKLESLGKSGANAVPEIVAYQRDPDVAVRFAAAEALLSAGGAQSADALRTSCQDGSGEIQRLAVAGIVNFYIPGYVKSGVRGKISELGNRLKRSEEPVVESYVRVRAEDIEALRKVLREGASPEAKLAAAQGLASLRAKAALPDLYPALKSKDDAMMLAALRAIENSGDKAAAQETVILLRDLNDRIQLRAISINGTARNEGALPDLAEVFARGRSPKSRAAALEAIAMIASPESKGLFEQNLAAKEGPLRGLAAEGLGRLGAQDQKKKIEDLYAAEGDMRARLGMAFALVQLGNRETTDFSPLTYLFNTLNSALWHNFAQAYLSELSREAGTRQALAGKLPTATKSEKIGLAWILASEGTAADQAAVDSLSHDSNPEVAREGIRAARALRARLP